MRTPAPLATTALAAAIVLALATAAGARADGFGLYKHDPKGKVRAARAADMDGDGRLDVVLLVEVPRGDAPAETELLVLRTPETPVPKSFYGEGDATRSLPPDRTGAVCILRSAGARGSFLFLSGKVVCHGTECFALQTLLDGGPGTPPVFWDAVADLDGDGGAEAWFPGRDGRVHVFGREGNGLLDFRSGSSSGSDERDLLRRTVYASSLAAADLDGDGKQELVGIVGASLVAFRLRDGAWVPERTVALPFLVPDPKRPAEEIRTPRLTLLDVDRDGKADLLVTLVHGRADQVGGMRTSLYHYAGPFWDAKTGALAAPKVRLDTESVALHPRFVDVDGDGRLDYVADSIRGNTWDLIRRVMGEEPAITYTAFLYDPAKGTYDASPYATFARPYSSGQAMSNSFGQSGFLDGDFDGDGHKDLLDLGNLTGVEVVRGKAGGSVASGGRASFDEPIVKRVTVSKPLAANALVADLNADGRADAVLWNEETLFLIVSKAGN